MQQALPSLPRDTTHGFGRKSRGRDCFGAKIIRWKIKRDPEGIWAKVQTSAANHRQIYEGMARPGHFKFGEFLGLSVTVGDCDGLEI